MVGLHASVLKETWMANGTARCNRKTEACFDDGLFWADLSFGYQGAGPVNRIEY